MSWRSPFEDRITEWVQTESATHAALPGAGRPIDLDAYFATPAEWRAGYAMLKSHGFCPAEVELLRQIKTLEERSAAGSGEDSDARWRRELTEAVARLGLALKH